MTMPFILVSVMVTALVYVVGAEDFDVVSISPVAIYAPENSGGATVTVIRTGGMQPCSAGFKTVAESAFPERDYIHVAGQLEYAPGQTIKEIVIPVIPNTVPEPARLFLVVLQNYSNCVPGTATTSTVSVIDAQTTETRTQTFEAGFPSGWEITTNSNTNGYWRFDSLAKGHWANSTGGRGNYAIADSCYYTEPMDTELRLPSFPVAVTALTYLVFKTDYLAGGSDVADVDVSGSGGDGPWTNLWRKHIADYPGPVMALIDLTPEMRGQSNVVVRFHYYHATNEWYWQIDDVAILVEPDSNTNGLPDWWEKAYYSGLTNLPPRGDSDGDGACDEDEFIAGTNPRDTGSCFKVDGLTRSNTNLATLFSSEIGHFYDLQSCPNLVDQIWTNQAERIQGMGRSTNFSLFAPGSNGFYRIEVHRW